VVERWSVDTALQNTSLRTGLSRRPSESGTIEAMTFDEFSALIDATYGSRDRARGQAATVAWLAEEVGELAKAARKGTREEQLHELGDVIAWTTSLANQLGISMTDAISRYAGGCPRCHLIPCGCP
jgi:NTP pyrophosphatase (non-canonical NTP hydrolase)